VIARIIEAMDAAPSLPSGVQGLGLDTSPTADPAMMTIVRRGVWNLTLAINALLPETRRHARHDADQLFPGRFGRVAMPTAGEYLPDIDRGPARPPNPQGPSS